MNNRYLLPYKKIVRLLAHRECKWSIGIYHGDSLCNFSSPKNIKNPVLTAKDVTDVKADFVADPFMILENGKWYMFFEVLNGSNNKGEIGLADSEDGYHWHYQQIVLREDFHLSYPYVFKFENEYYMIPESYQANSIRLYKAVDFPKKWFFVKNLLEGRDYVDASIFNYHSKWWLFSSTQKSDILYLYYADNLLDNWTHHPQSPVIKENIKIARPGGRVVVFEDRIFRYTQDDEKLYGNQVRAFEITKLTTTTYAEEEISGNPILKSSGFGWNKTGMHHIDPHLIGKNQWIACVDGYRMNLVFGKKK
jgi:hypothetical protein